MPYSDIVIKNEVYLEPYYYARKCIAALGDLAPNFSNDFDEDDFEKFLQELLRVKRKYGPQNKDNFNVFWMLNLAYKEETHSAFIGELLNPRGMHGKGDAFLDLFCKQMKIHFPLNTYKLLEHSFEDGRLDIYLPCNEDPSKSIIIENKIDASDQKSQLKRYHSSFPKAKLFYLTKNGRKASDESTGGEHDFYTCISYNKDILKWLKSCKEKCDKNEDGDILKMIGQYEDIVRMLTVETMSDDERKEVETVFQKCKVPLNCLRQNNSEIERKFDTHVEDTFKKVAQSMGAKLIEKGMIKKDGGEKFSVFDKKYNGISFKFDEWDDCVVRLEFQGDKYQNIFFGIRYIGEDCQKKGNLFKDLKEMFKGYFGQDNKTGAATKKFLVGADWLRYQKWNSDCYLRVLDGTFENDLQRLVENIKWYMKVCLSERKS